MHFLSQHIHIHRQTQDLPLLSTEPANLQTLVMSSQMSILAPHKWHAGPLTCIKDGQTAAHFVQDVLWIREWRPVQLPVRK